MSEFSRAQDFEESGWFEHNELDSMDFALNCRQRLADYFAQNTPGGESGAW